MKNKEFQEKLRSEARERIQTQKEFRSSHRLKRTMTREEAMSRFNKLNVNTEQSTKAVKFDNESQECNSHKGSGSPTSPLSPMTKSFGLSPTIKKRAPLK